MKRVLNRKLVLEGDSFGSPGRPHFDNPGGNQFNRLNQKCEDFVSKGQELQKLGEKLSNDKSRLEIQRDEISQSQTADLQVIAALDEVITSIQEQYEEEVVDEQTRVQESLKETTKEMQESSKELEEQARELREIKMDRASTDASAAADEADAKRQVFERTSSEYIEKLNIQIEQAAMMYREMRSRRLKGR